MNKEGRFQVKYGDPAEDPKKPVPVDDAIEIANAGLPAYLYVTKDAALQFLNPVSYTHLTLPTIYSV